MQTKFTPGPWVIVYDNCDERSGGQWYTAGPAEVWWPYGTSQHDEALANANLIAAAPENYSAHEYLLDGLRKVLAGVPVRDMDERILASEKALAKARGE